jgi:hypothetical protein
MSGLPARLDAATSQGEFFSSAGNTPLRKRSSSTSEGWDMLEEQQQDVFNITPSLFLPACSRYAQSNTLASSPRPSYDFPGTWPAAIHDTTSALTQVGSATTSYATALTHSGIGKAGWSVGAAIAYTANKRALSLVDWATDHTGTGADQLPRPIAGWLKSGKEKAKERRRAELRKKERQARRARGERSPDGRIADGEAVFLDEQGPFALETSEMDSTGELMSGPRPVLIQRSEDDGFAVASTQGGSIDKEEEKVQRGEYPEHDDEEPEDDDEEPEDDDEEPEDDDEEPEADGLIRLFEFDD